MAYIEGLGYSDDGTLTVSFLMDGAPYAIKQLLRAPEVGDHVRFHGELYEVTGRMWMYDVEPPEVAVVIKPVKTEEEGVK